MDQADVVRAIGERVAVDANGPVALVEGLKGREKRFTLVIDALDEAADTRGITKLLRELAPIPHVWVAVGTRPNEHTEDAERRFTALGPRTVEIDLDDPAVARRAGTNFLIASILCRTLMDADSPPDVTGQNWQDLSGIDEAFDDYLNRFDNLRFTTRLDRRRVYNMLRPLAFAEGQGLPWDNVWAMLASAISGEPYSDSDIEELLNHAGAYIIETLEHGCSVYRLYHQALADYFRRDESHGRQIQRRIVDALDRSIPIDTNVGGPIWRNTHWYILAHYAAHAAAADYTDKLRGRLLDGFFATRKLELTDVGALIVDYEYLPGDADLRLIQSAMRLSAHVIARDPRQFASQLVGRLLPHMGTSAVWDFIHGVIRAAPRSWLRPLSPALQPPRTGLLRTVEGHAGPVRAVAVTPDSRRAVSASDDVTLKVWELETGREVRTLAGHADRVMAVAVTPDGQRAVSASTDKTLKVWDLESDSEPRTLQGHKGGVNAVAVTPDGRAVSGSRDRTLKVWDLESGRELQTLSGHTDRVNAVAVAPDGRTVSGSRDGTLKVWDLESGRELHTLSGHTDRVNAVAVTSDGRRAVSASSDRTLRVWDIESGRELHTLFSHTDEVNAVAVMPNGRAVSGSADRTLKVWDLEPPLAADPSGHAEGVEAVAVTPEHAVSASADRTLKVWELESGRELHTLSGHAGGVYAVAVAVTPDRRLAVSASADWTLKVWNIESGRELHTIAGRAGHADHVRAVAVTPDGLRAVSASRDWTLKVWEFESDSEPRILQGHKGEVRAVAVTPDGRRAVSASTDRTLKVWNLESGRELHTLSGHAGWVMAVAVTPERAVSASTDGTLKVWELESGRELHTLSGHAAWVSVRAVAVTPNGRRAVSASDDGTVKVWDLESGRELQTLSGHAAWVSIRAVAVTSNGRHAVSASADRTLTVWELESGSPIATFSCDAPATCCVLAKDSTVVAGDEAGRVYILALEN